MRRRLVWKQETAKHTHTLLRRGLGGRYLAGDEAQTKAGICMSMAGTVGRPGGGAMQLPRAGAAVRARARQAPAAAELLLLNPKP
jgi:hypothetical protein